MREVNFSIPNVNKASVHITTTLYDRRALDCTSTLPLINSLNHLAYLTTSSARIRDILTVDGGVERLVCILKQGRSKDVMDMWKWNLAFQCVVNIGVRGSEEVRTRVVEADMVPVIATILDNYSQIVERRRLAAEAEQTRRNEIRFASSSRSMLSGQRADGPSTHFHQPTFTRSTIFDRPSGSTQTNPIRRHAPPPIAIPHGFAPLQPSTADRHPADNAGETATVFSSPPERTTFNRPQLHQHQRSHDGRGTTPRPPFLQPLATAVPSMDTADGFSLRPVRDVDRLPSMLPGFQTGVISNPESPTTPLAPAQPRVLPPIAAQIQRRPSIRQQRSISGDSEGPIGDESAFSEEAPAVDTDETLIANRDEIALQGTDDRAGEIRNAPALLSVRIPAMNDAQEQEAFQLAPRLADAGIVNANITPVTGTMAFSPVGPAPPLNAASPAMPAGAYPGVWRGPVSPTGAQAAMPRDEDVLMSLQLLAYVSKYCNLRHYFQQTHLVPRLKLDAGVSKSLASDPMSPTPMEEEHDENEFEEYLLPDDFNLFPLVEKFTPRHHSKDMQYWACVVMRNLCRKDDKNGGIRQCAYYECGKWEEYPRQFAKCRRCRRTKYCSKECQKAAWIFHR